MDKVFIEDLEVETIIGIFGWEREVKQIVRISLETVSYTHLTLPTT